MEAKKKYGWGGKRPNQTGRPRLDPEGSERRKHSVYVTQEELRVLRDFLGKYRQATVNGEKEIRYQVADLKQN